MGNGENKEIDLLLQRLGQREISTSSSDPTLDELAGPGDHLDPDELSSFAEGVIPAAVRSRYVAHVADCSRCRRIVAQLALASGAGLRSPSTELSKSGLWKSIAGFFAPPVMRYAVPAMSLLILTAIGVVWFQQTRRADSVAQMSQPAMAPAEVPSQPNKLAQEQRREDSVGAKGEGRTASVAEGTVRDEEKTKAKTEAVGTDSLQKEHLPAKPQAGLKDTVVPPPPAAAAAESNTAFSPKPPNETEESKKTESVTQRQVQALPSAAARSEDARRADEDKADLSANKKAEARRNTGSLGMSRDGRVAVAPGSAGPTRTVAGRQFRRVDNTWIDTAYEPSTQAHSISRGSEQYRALVGDEPGLRMIAEQLEGEVIVLWKGRAYRIR